MWETWLYKTLIAFLSIRILNIVFKNSITKAFKKTNKTGVGTIKATINSLLIAMIPVLRWIFVLLVFMVIFSATFIDEEK